MEYNELIRRRSKCDEEKDRTAFSNCVKELIKDRYKDVYYCCDGYIEKENMCMPCKEGRYGFECESACRCNEGNTLHCDNETGECKCKASFWGTHCECSGSSTCPNNLQNCTCEATFQRKIEEINTKNKEHLERTIKETKVQIEQQLVNVKRHRNYLTIGLSCVIILSIFLLLLIIMYRIKIRKLRQDLRTFSTQYSNDKDNRELNNNVVYSS